MSAKANGLSAAETVPDVDERQALPASLSTLPNGPVLRTRPFTDHCAPTSRVHWLYAYPCTGTAQNAVFCWEFITLHVHPSLGSGLQAGDSRKAGVDASHASTRAFSVRAQDGETYQAELAVTGRGDSSLHTALVTCYLRRC